LSSGKKTPKIINKLGKLLPYAIMGMLVVYCLKDITFISVGDFLPAVIGCVIVAALYIWKRNTLLSIIAGTISYMLLVQLIF
jgi:branched-subunit amino acid transport protein AzlD